MPPSADGKSTTPGRRWGDALEPFNEYSAPAREVDYSDDDPGPEQLATIQLRPLTAPMRGRQRWRLASPRT